MKTLPIALYPLCLLFLAALSGCGGGGGGSGGNSSLGTTPATTPVTCNLPLEYANSGTSGVLIGTSTPAVKRSMPSTCDMTRLQSARLTLCIDHPMQQELTGLLTLSDQEMARLNVQDGQLKASTCLANQTPTTAVLEFSFSFDRQGSPAQWQGPWNVVITDTVQNNQNGHLVAWGLEIQGTR